MNLLSVSIEDIPVDSPLPWRLYDRHGYIVFARGEVVASRKQLEGLIAEGLLRDIDATPQSEETDSWAESRGILAEGAFPPRGIKPQIGERVQLRLLDQRQQPYYSARLIGYIRKQSLLVTRPMSAASPFIPVEGQQVEVRMVTGNNIYAFQSTIQRLCISPSQYMHLDFPSKVHVQQLRKSPWVRVSLGVIVTDVRGVHEAARLVNLSPDGAQLHAPPTLGYAGEKLRVSFHVAMDELKTTLNLDATIQHVHMTQTGQEDESNMQEYGIAFQNVSTVDALWLQALVYRSIAEGGLT